MMMERWINDESDKTTTTSLQAANKHTFGYVHRVNPISNCLYLPFQLLPDMTRAQKGAGG